MSGSLSPDLESLGVVVQVLVGFGLGVLCYLFDGSEMCFFLCSL